MQVIPVLDLMDGEVVRAVGGRRERYRRLSGSCLVASCDPMAVASSFHERLGCESVYLADLDAIAGAAPAVSTYGAIGGVGLSLWIDAGVRDAADAVRIREAGADVVIAGLETLPSPTELASMVKAIGAGSLCFSLDLRDGRPIIASSAWSGMDAIEIALAAADAGVERTIVLDLASVGAGAGTATLALCETLHDRRPDVALIAGGGIRDINDLLSLRHAGVVGALVATALHDGRIGRNDIQCLSSRAID